MKLFLAFIQALLFVSLTAGLQNTAHAARDFTKNTSNHLSLGAGAIGPLLNGAAGVTFACWVIQDTQAVTDGDDVFLANHSTLGSVGLRLRHGTGIRLTGALRRQNADTGNVPLGATTLSTGIWYHVGVTVTFGSNGKVYLNGADDGTTMAGGSVATTSGTFVSSTGTNHDALGAAFSGTAPISTARQLDGRMAEAALWNIELTAADFASLARGFTPDQIRPQNLVAYWPFIGDGTNIRDLRNTKNGTITGSIPRADHPRTYQ
jgi:hypothetical protein